jgi:hypothetical protein
MVEIDRHIVIVGHGPSLKGAGLGKQIDEFKVVVRLKNCSMLLAERHDYGSKTTVMCSSTEVLHHLPKIEAKEYWGYPKKGDFSESRVTWLKRHVPQNSKVHVPLDVCNLWNAAFLELGGQHPNVSTGMGAVIIALQLKRPKKLFLAGFDNVLHPNTEGYRSTVATEFNQNGTVDTGHDWLTENKLIPFLATAYGTEIMDLAGTYKALPAVIQTYAETLEARL